MIGTTMTRPEQFDTFPLLLSQRTDLRLHIYHLQRFLILGSVFHLFLMDILGQDIWVTNEWNET